MKIEVLYPEMCNVFGELANARYLRASAPEAEIVETPNQTAPLFAQEKVDLLYIGAMPESKQRLALSRLMPYRDVLWARIEAGMPVLATGNALELFGTRIVHGDTVTPALDYFPYEARIDTEHRHNSMFVGQFADMEIVGNKSQFSFCYGQFDHPFVHVEGGVGMNPAENREGVHYKNLFGTYLLGPFLVLNPRFTAYLLKLLGSAGAPAFEKQAMEAYQYRLNLLKTPGVNFIMGEHG